MPKLRTFNTQNEREIWLIENADYFTVIYRRDLRNHRLEVPNLKAAREAARRISLELKVNTLIYAVSGISDTFVEGVEYTQQGLRTKYARSNTSL